MTTPRTCYVLFEASSTQEYAYDCGELLPTAGGLVVVLVGKDSKPKLVRCKSVVDGIDPIVSKKIFGIVLEQPTASIQRQESP